MWLHATLYRSQHSYQLFYLQYLYGLSVSLRSLESGITGAAFGSVGSVLKSLNLTTLVILSFLLGQVGLFFCWARLHGISLLTIRLIYDSFFLAAIAPGELWRSPVPGRVRSHIHQLHFRWGRNNFCVLR